MDTTWSSSPHWGTFWGQFQIELLGGTISAFLFLFLVLWLFKPKIKIAPFLCEVTQENNKYYSFKFINKSFFSAHEITAELHLLSKIPMGNGYFNNEYKKLTLANNHISHIPKRPNFWFQRNPGHPHCITIRSTENIKEILTDQFHAILLKISLKHGLTGLSNVFEQEYANLEDIKIGKFKPGIKFGCL